MGDVRALQPALGLGLTIAPALATAAPAPADLALLHRASWGLSAQGPAGLALRGRRLRAARRLRPPATDALPPQAQAEVDTLGLGRKPLIDEVRNLDAVNRFANGLVDPDQKKAAQAVYQQAMNQLARDASTRSLLRDLYSPDQLKEQMTWFWMNHFNVHQAKADIRAMVGDYEETAIRPHALG